MRRGGFYNLIGLKVSRFSLTSRSCRIELIETSIIRICLKPELMVVKSKYRFQNPRRRLVEVEGVGRIAPNFS